MIQSPSKYWREILLKGKHCTDGEGDRIDSWPLFRIFSNLQVAPAIWFYLSLSVKCLRCCQIFESSTFQPSIIKSFTLRKYTENYVLETIWNQKIWDYRLKFPLTLLAGYSAVFRKLIWESFYTRAQEKKCPQDRAKEKK